MLDPLYMRASRVWITAIVVLSLSVATSAENVSRAKGGHVPSWPDRTSNFVVSVGGGVVGFIARGARDAIGPGTGWDARVAFGHIADIRTEIAYTGSVQELSERGAWLVGHGVLGLFRVNVTPHQPFEAFFYIGAGWSRFHIENATNRAFASPDHVVEIPFGGGVARRYGRLVFDARAGVSVLSGADMIPAMNVSSTEKGESMHRFSLRVTVGFEL